MYSITIKKRITVSNATKLFDQQYIHSAIFNNGYIFTIVNFLLLRSANHGDQGGQGPNITKEVKYIKKVLPTGSEAKNYGLSCIQKIVNQSNYYLKNVLTLI